MSRRSRLQREGNRVRWKSWPLRSSSGVLSGVIQRRLEGVSGAHATGQSSAQVARRVQRTLERPQGGCLTHRPEGPVINRRLHQGSGRTTELCAGLSMRNPRSDFDQPISTIPLGPPSGPWKQGTNSGNEESGPEGPEHAVRADPAERRPQAPPSASALLSFNSLYCGHGSSKNHPQTTLIPCMARGYIKSLNTLPCAPKVSSRPSGVHPRRFSPHPGNSSPRTQELGAGQDGRGERI